MLLNGDCKTAGYATSIRSHLVIVIALAAFVASSVATLGNAATAAPSEEGRSVYAQHCASCHGSNLAGSVGPALTGPRFAARWDGKAASLLGLITATMPIGAGGSLSPSEYEAVTKYVISFNSGKENASPDLHPVASSAPTAHSMLAIQPKVFGVTSASGPDDSELRAPAPGDWLSYNRVYEGQRFSPLTNITPGNVGRLVPKCIFQTGEVGSFQASPLVYKGKLYFTTAHKTFAVDGASCRQLWVDDHPANGAASLIGNRGVALYRGTVLRGTLDCHVIALDAATGKALWDEQVCDGTKGAFISAAPVVFDGKLFIGEAGADTGASGHIHALEATTGRQLWAFATVPTGGAAGSESWKNGAVAGGGSTWSTITVDPAARLLYVPVGNPYPDLDVSVRQGDNLYTNSVVALDADSGKLRWYVQQSANDFHDWDTAAAPMIYELGQRKLMAVGSKDAQIYFYDRISHALFARQEVSRRENVARPMTTEYTHVCPGFLGGVQWNGPAYDPGTHTLFVNSVDWCAKMRYKSGGWDDVMMDSTSQARGFLHAFDAGTGASRWVYNADGPMLAGVTPTASGVILTGTTTGDFIALDSQTGAKLYAFNTGGALAGGISTYMVANQQYVAVLSGNMSKGMWQTNGGAMLVVFGLP